MQLIGLEAIYRFVPTPASQTQGMVGLSVLAQGAGDQPGQPSVGHRHHLHTHGLGVSSTWWPSWTGTGRYVLAWRLSNTLEVDFCVAALEEALSKGRPQIFNTDQGSQFTWRGLHQHAAGARRSSEHGRQGPVHGQRLRGTAVAQSSSTSEVYLKAYQNGTEARKGIGAYLAFYNQERPHQAPGLSVTGSKVFQASEPGKVFTGRSTSLTIG